MMNFDFTGKNVVVTGAGSGIGKGIALEFADNGANVWIGEIVDDHGNATLQELQKHGERFGYTKADISSRVQVEKMFAAANSALGGIDIVVNAAGIFCFKGFFEATPEDIRGHLDVNLLGTIYGCQIGVDYMKKQGRGGKIVNISSVGGRQGELESPFYALGKSGVINFTQSAAYNAAPYGINVNAVCPGTIRTPMIEAILAEKAGKKGNTDGLFMDLVKSRSPLGVPQTVEDMAYATLFLCSDYAKNITGQALNVCGGFKMN